MSDFVLPSNIVTKVEVSRLVNEVERVDNELTAASVRMEVEGASNEQSSPAMSDQLVSFLQQNNLNLDNSNERSELIRKLRVLKNTVPVINMTFSTEADRESLQRLAEWVRESIHPNAVLAVGLQPNLVAGVYVRTPNRVYDLSLRTAFKNQHKALVDKIGELRVSTQ